MIITVKALLKQYKNYKDPHGKIRRDVENNLIFPIVRGIYETNQNTPGELLSSVIYGPSYLSFEYALSHHGLIPERVVLYTNATYDKRRSKLYQTPFGNFSYRDIPKAAYKYEVETILYDDYVVFMATPEKALCDKLYLERPVSNLKELSNLIFSDLRIDRNMFDSLDKEKLLSLIPKYKATNLKLLKKIIDKEDLQ